MFHRFGKRNVSISGDRRTCTAESAPSDCGAIDQERIALAAEHVGAQLDAPRRLVHRVGVELPLGVDVDGARAAAAALRRELAAVLERLGHGRRRVAVAVVQPACVSKCSRELFHEKPTRAIHLFERRLMMPTSMPWYLCEVSRDVRGMKPLLPAAIAAGLGIHVATLYGLPSGSVPVKPVPGV